MKHLIIAMVILLCLLMAGCTNQPLIDGEEGIKKIETYIDCEEEVVCYGVHTEENWMLCEIDRDLITKLCK